MNSADKQSPVVRPFGDDETVRWSCRAGEYILWVGTDSFLTADREDAWTIRDFWQMRDGDFVTITNRWADVPAWFELHPLEVAGVAVGLMKKRLDAGYKPQDPIHAPNIWRVKAGDRIVWISVKDYPKSIRQILACEACAIVLGENASPGAFDSVAVFGAPEGKSFPPNIAAMVKFGFQTAVGAGVPTVFAEEWRFGA